MRWNQRLGSIGRKATDPMVLVGMPQPYHQAPRTTPDPRDRSAGGKVDSGGCPDRGHPR